MGIDHLCTDCDGYRGFFLSHDGAPPLFHSCPSCRGTGLRSDQDAATVFGRAVEMPDADIAILRAMIQAEG